MLRPGVDRMSNAPKETLRTVPGHLSLLLPLRNMTPQASIV